MDTTKVLLAFGPRMLRELLRRAVSAEDDLRIVGEVAVDDTDVVEEILEAVRRTRPHVVVLTLVESGRISATGARILAEHPSIGVLLLADRIAAALICRGVPARCRDFTLHATDHVLRAIRAARSLT